MKTIGGRLKHLRGAETQEDLSSRAGVSLPAYRKWEQDTTPPKADAAIKLASALNTTPGYILFGTEEQTCVPKPLLDDLIPAMQYLYEHDKIAYKAVLESAQQSVNAIKLGLGGTKE